MRDGTSAKAYPGNLLPGSRAFSAIGEMVPAAIFVTRADDGQAVYANRAFFDILGGAVTGDPTPAVPTQCWRDIFFDGAERDALLGAFLTDGAVRNREVRLRGAGADAVWALLSMAPIATGGVPLTLTSFIDVSPLKRAEAEIRQLADQDALTGLPNMRCIRDRLERAVSRVRRYGGRVGVLFVDLDGFKAVNDSHGHDAGDAVLQEVALRLKGVVRRSDTVGRLGGDEFVLILTDVKRHDDLTIVADRAVAALAEPFAGPGWSVTVGASIGVASCPENASASADLLKRADEAMYQVKRAGKNSYRLAA